MTLNRKLCIFVAGALLATGSIAAAQDGVRSGAADRADIWTTIERQWSAQERGEESWIDELLMDDFSGWGKTSPAPRGKSSTKMWNRFNAEISDLVAHELYPLSIVVNGDVGVAHYLYSSATRLEDGKIESDNGRYTDILLRTEDGWKFIGWHGGDDE